MSYSIEVVVVNQEENKSLSKDLSVQYVNEYESSEPRGLYKWPFMSSVSGVWYTIGTDDDGTFWALQMVDTDFDKHLAVSAPWIKDEEELENFTPVIIKENYLNDFEQLLAEMLEVSPMNTIMILPRYQGGDTEIIQGTISLKEYIQLIKEEKIPFNVCTIVKK